MKKLPRHFYARPTIDVAIELLGCEIIAEADGIKTGGIIVETEAYIGTTDPACHACRGMTRRNHVMFEEPGRLYVYFTYGNHFMLNIVTERNGYPGAVLLRALEPSRGIEEMGRRRATDDFTNIASGPGKLAKALGVNTMQNGIDLSESVVYLKGPSKLDEEILTSSRIGIGERGTERLWRFFFDGNPHVSVPNKAVRESITPLRRAREIGFTLTG